MNGTINIRGLRHRSIGQPLSPRRLPAHLFGNITRLPREVRHMKSTLIAVILKTIRGAIKGVTITHCVGLGVKI